MEAVRRVDVCRRRRLLRCVVLLFIRVFLVDVFITRLIIDLATFLLCVLVSLARLMCVVLDAVKALATFHVKALWADEIAIDVADLVIATVAATFDHQELVSTGEDVFRCASLRAGELLSAVEALAACEVEAIITVSDSRLSLWLTDLVRAFITGLFDGLYLVGDLNHDVFRAESNLITPVVKANIRVLEESGSEADVFRPGTIGSEQGTADGAHLLEVILRLESDLFTVEVEDELPEIAIVFAIYVGFKDREVADLRKLEVLHTINDSRGQQLEHVAAKLDVFARRVDRCHTHRVQSNHVVGLNLTFVELDVRQRQRPVSDAQVEEESEVLLWLRLTEPDRQLPVIIRMDGDHRIKQTLVRSKAEEALRLEGLCAFDVLNSKERHSVAFLAIDANIVKNFEATQNTLAKDCIYGCLSTIFMEDLSAGRLLSGVVGALLRLAKRVFECQSRVGARCIDKKVDGREIRTD